MNRKPKKGKREKNNERMNAKPFQCHDDLAILNHALTQNRRNLRQTATKSAQKKAKDLFLVHGREKMGIFVNDFWKMCLLSRLLEIYTRRHVSGTSTQCNGFLQHTKGNTPCV
jgi:hypothetical protein